MPQTYEPPENPYIIDTESGAETARLIEQDRLFTHAMGGLLPEQPPEALPEDAAVLDLACGPGMWACDLAFAFRERGIEVCGVDLSSRMVQYAQATALAQGLGDSTEFRQADVRQRLPFADGTFDLVNGRFLVGVLDQISWPGVLAEGWRVLKPGGILRLTECELAISSSPTLQRLVGLLSQALWKQGRTFSVDGQTLGIAHRLGKLLLDAGLQGLQQRAFLLDTSYHQPLHYHLLKETEITLTLLGPYLIASGLITEETYSDLLRQLVLEMLQEDFTCLTFGLTAWARTPLASSPIQHEEATPAVPEPA